MTIMLPSLSASNRYGAAVVLAVAFLSISYGSPAHAQFDKANQEFAAGRFDEAIREYQALVEKGEYSASLFYDLGNAYYRTADFGRAILNYERALALDPHQPEAEANLRIAQEQARALQLPLGSTEKISRFASINALSITAAAGGWVFLFVLTASLFWRRWSNRNILLAACCALISATAAAVLYARETGGHGRAFAVITAKDVEARVATADNANRVLALPPGSEIQILSQRGDWMYASLPNQMRGWVPAKSAERVRL